MIGILDFRISEGGESVKLVRRGGELISRGEFGKNSKGGDRKQGEGENNQVINCCFEVTSTSQIEQKMDPFFP